MNQDETMTITVRCTGKEIISFDNNGRTGPLYRYTFRPHYHKLLRQQARLDIESFKEWDIGGEYKLKVEPICLPVLD